MKQEKIYMLLPTFDNLMNPLLQALRMLGGSGSVEEIYFKTIELQRMIFILFL